ncbi:MAG: N-acetyltransferase family protein [Mesorhizobium sp.]|nr:N-acetyltransferase family protein [Mesorhizobium sp.]
MDTIDIRAARAADIARVAMIYADAVIHGTASYELEPPSLSDMEQRFTALAASGYPYVVATSGGDILGYAYAGPFRPRRAYRFMVEDSIYLAPEAQGRGIGRLLLGRLVQECTSRGFRQIAAVIGDGERNLASVRLHAAAGFRHAGVLEGSGYKHGRWLDTVFMQLTINGGKDLPPDPESLPERALSA